MFCENKYMQVDLFLFIKEFTQPSSKMCFNNNSYITKISLYLRMTDSVHFFFDKFSKMIGIIITVDTSS